MQFIQLLFAIGVLSQERIKDRWVKAPRKDNSFVGRVLNSQGQLVCLGLVNLDKSLQTMPECLNGRPRFNVSVVVESGPSEGRRRIREVWYRITKRSRAVGQVKLKTNDIQLTRLNAVDITRDFDYHVNFVAYRVRRRGLEKRSFKYISPDTCFEEYSNFEPISQEQFHTELFCVTPTAGRRVRLVPGSPLVAHPRVNQSNRYVSGLFKTKLQSKLFYFTKQFRLTYQH
ncbi:hypothetical protein DSO57_1010381 [Entomophthora muscae]|uniref:Uncharacterized protein n=1 Tax=Entomophthora muscae TaxID=34485 RepID=A0ACC2URK0_9FUNG|nr:hypothetical protein DSO57_1010381 [Entomophthora muscae]